MASDLPQRHHYIPEFYLKGWVSPDGRLCQYSRNGGAVKPLRRSPKATGFVDGLYQLEGFPPHLKQQIECKFFRPVDSLAADALRQLNQGNVTLNARLRSAWTRFLLSLLLRCPEDIDILKNWWKIEFIRTDETEEMEYQSRRSASDPETFSEYLMSRPIHEVEIHGYNTLIKLIDNARVGQTINNMHWKIVQLSKECVPLMTSDRPIIRTNGLIKPNGHLAIPIDPTRLFVATSDDKMIEYLNHAPLRQIAKEVNQHIVRSAVRFSYAVDDSHLKFVKKNFGIAPQERLIESIIRPIPGCPPAMSLKGTS
ncbi:MULTISPECIES: DUF4238 domain-containing protein [unclassified Xanthobacter]|uniref:DUF4238 domain-containing protein n=1 Tax=unclassified Xanthobacter TaxID=2623496 RepID=UPI00145E2644|nr:MULTISPECIES: DUF4238 domain-containing protein [unclassified Xanthobacter]NMN57422.1 hypothetical protein [Xanthobacter sp. SG618]UJX46969.1 DUF4238 domain-containing protein [Xanthobacter sp. YC-JY1]